MENKKTALITRATDTDLGKVSGMDETNLFDNPFSAFEVAKAGYEGMLEGKLDIIAGVKTSQKIMFKFLPFTPRKIALKQTFDMQKVS